MEATIILTVFIFLLPAALASLKRCRSSTWSIALRSIIVMLFVLFFFHLIVNTTAIEQFRGSFFMFFLYFPGFFIGSIISIISLSNDVLRKKRRGDVLILFGAIGVLLSVIVSIFAFINGSSNVLLWLILYSSLFLLLYIGSLFRKSFLKELSKKETSFSA